MLLQDVWHPLLSFLLLFSFHMLPLLLDHLGLFLLVVVFLLHQRWTTFIELRGFSSFTSFCFIYFWYRMHYMYPCFAAGLLNYPRQLLYYYVIFWNLHNYSPCYSLLNLTNSYWTQSRDLVERNQSTCQKCY